MHCLIDADSIVYRAGFATEGEPIQNTLQTAKNMLQTCYSKGETHSVYLTGEGNFRKELYPEYKANRTGKRPQAYDEIREYMQKHHGAQVSKGIEADDLVSIAANALRDNLVEHVVCSIDKDLNTFPGIKYNYVKDYTYTVSREEANKAFITQIITGDKSDNILGMKFLDVKKSSPWYTMAKDNGLLSKRLGPVRAAKIIEALEAGCIGSGVSLNFFLSSLFADRMDELELNGTLLWMTREVKNGEPVRFDLARWINFEEGG